jgi:carbon storage regulator CsrA
MTLKLSRRMGEQIVIDGQIVIRITQIKGNRVILAIDTPAGTDVRLGQTITGRESVSSPTGKPFESAEPLSNPDRDLSERRDPAAAILPSVR